MSLLPSTDKSRDGGDTDDGAAGGRLGRHLRSCRLNGEEGAIEIRADGFGEEVGFYAAQQRSVAVRSISRIDEGLLQELSECTDTRIADEDVEPTPMIDHLFDESFARFWI